MRHSIISVVMAMAMLVPATGSALAGRQGRNGNREKTTYIDLTGDDNDSKKNDAQRNQNPQQSVQPSQEQPADPSQQDQTNPDAGNPEDTGNQQSENGAGAETVDAGDYQNQSTEYPEEDQKAGTSIFVWISLIVSAAALAFSALAYNKLSKIEKERKAKAKSSRRSSQLDDVFDRIGSLEEQISKLNSERAAPSKQYQQIPPKPSYRDSQRNSGHTVPPASIKKYACTVMGEGFPTDSVFEHPEQDAIAVLTVKGNRASFVINPDESAQRRLLMNFNYSVGRISDVLEKAANPSSILTVEPGQAELRGDEWMIVRKASVKLV